MGTEDTRAQERCLGSGVHALGDELCPGICPEPSNCDLR